MIFPRRPVAATVVKSTAFCLAKRRTLGIARSLPAITGAPTLPDVSDGTSVGACASACGASALSAAGAAACVSAASAAPDPSPSNSTKGAPTSTIVPASTYSFVMVPVYGDKISCNNLSFCTSAIGSSSLIVSPTLTSQEAISPSAIPSPTSGILKISVIISLPYSNSTTFLTAVTTSSTCGNQSFSAAPNG